jgi:hypothetical protein
MWTLTLVNKQQHVKHLKAFSASADRFPSQINDYALKTLRSLADPEFQEECTAFLQTLRSAFGFKRSDLSTTLSPGFATIKTPILSATVKLLQGSDSKHYFIETSVSFENDSSAKTHSGLNAVTGVFLHKVVFSYGTSISLDNTIDLLENTFSPKVLEYPLDMSYIKVKDPAIPFSVTFESERVTIESPEGQSNTWSKFTQAMEALKGALPT